MKEEKILRGIQKKKEKYLEEAMQEYGRLIYSLIEGFIHSDHAAVEEVFNDVFIELWNNASRIDLSRGSLKNMLCLIAKSRALDFLKKTKRYKQNVEYTEELGLCSEAVDETMIKEENYQELCDVIRCLKEPAATIFQMYYFQNQSIVEIAFEMNMKREQIYNHLSRGRKKLRGLLEQGGGNVNE